MIRSASEIARSAFESIGEKTASLGRSASPKSFEEVLATDSTTVPAGSEAAEPISRIREKLAKVVTDSLQSIGISLDPALTFEADRDGELRLQNDHPLAAEIEATLRENPEVRSLAGQLLGSANFADRRLVLHSVAGV